jgi:hypothetical protein
MAATKPSALLTWLQSRRFILKFGRIVDFRG